MYLLAEALLAGVLLSGVLPFEVLLAVEGEMVLAVSVFLEKKERIPLGLETPEEEGVGYFKRKQKNPQAHGYRCSLHPGVFQSIDFPQRT